MKLATYRDGSRDGQLVVVSSDLTTAHYASAIATRLQQVLDDWNFLSPQLEDLARTLNHGKARHAFAFDPSRCMAPLPRAYQRVDATAYLGHLERLITACGAELGEDLRASPSLVQACSDDLGGARDDVDGLSEADGIDFEAQLAVVTGDATQGCTAQAGIDRVRLLMLANAVRLRHRLPDERAPEIGALQSRPRMAFSPVAVTPEELGSAWRDGRVGLALECRRSGTSVGRCDAGAGMTFHFGQLIAQLCQSRSARAGSIVCSGAVSSPDRTSGCSCIAEMRALEVIDDGVASTPFLRRGDVVRIDMHGADGHSVFGAIEQRVVGTAA
jgi:fumarylacetoacetate (FAA) hydrolase